MTLKKLLDNIDSIIKENESKSEKKCELTSSLEQRMEIMQLIEKSAHHFK